MPRACLAEFRLETERLVLREWRAADRVPFHQMSQDNEVMRYLGQLASWPAIDAAMARMAECQSRHGFCFWALECRADKSFVGFCGIKPGKAPIEDDIEIGWRLARPAWGKGYAFEAAQAALCWAWEFLDVLSIAAITVPANLRSWGLMERLGMIRDPEGDFDHPEIAPGNPLRRHILYRIHRPQ